MPSNKEKLVNNNTNEYFTEGVILNDCQRMSLVSWQKMCKTTRNLLWLYLIASVSLIIFNISNHSNDLKWFWLLTISSLIIALFLFSTSFVLRMMIHNGRPNQQLREDLLKHDDESVVTANNFYILIIKMLLLPSLLLTIVAVGFGGYITNNIELTSLGSLMAFIYITVLSLGLVTSINTFVFLKKIKTLNKSIVITKPDLDEKSDLNP